MFGLPGRIRADLCGTPRCPPVFRDVAYVADNIGRQCKPPNYTNGRVGHRGGTPTQQGFSPARGSGARAIGTDPDPVIDAGLQNCETNQKTKGRPAADVHSGGAFVHTAIVLAFAGEGPHVCCPRWGADDAIRRCSIKLRPLAALRGTRNMPSDKPVSARTLRRRKQQSASLCNIPSRSPRNGPMKFEVRGDGSIEWLCGCDWRWLDRVCAEGKTVAEICDLVGVPRHPTCHDLVYADGSVTEAEPRSSSPRKVETTG